MSASPDPGPRHMSNLITYIAGDLFRAPSGTILVHACNTIGSWGGGIALEFRRRYPLAYEQYRNHCKSSSPNNLIGTCLLIPGETHDIACLFTSRAYGKRKDSPEEILAATRSALEDLVSQNTKGKLLHACRFNSGKFGVPWESTERILREISVQMTVLTPAS